MTEPLTLMAVHAHPDDEATTTGGILARYSAEGVRTVLVTCTNGELGDLPGGTTPEHDEHDEQAVVALRRAELAESARILGVAHLEMLGYRDSGMAGWPTNEAPGAFATLPVDQAARPLAALMRRYHPEVVVTYDAFGFYGHPDHIQAHRTTLAALEMSGSRARLFFPGVRRSRLAEFARRMSDLGLELPVIEDDRFGCADEDIAAIVDCRAHAGAKLGSVRAHASQGENLFFLRFPEDQFADLFGVEEFVLARGDLPVPPPVDDLFAGLRGSAATR